MIKIFALPVVFFSAISSPEFSLVNHGQIQSSEQLFRTNKDHEVAIFGDIFGAGALKKDCLELWGGYSKHASVVQDKCNKASREIDFAKEEYPKILALVKSLTLGSSTSDNAILDYNRIQLLKQKCQDKTAIRAAKTVRYWGTTEVGSTPDVKNKVLTSLSNLNASEYRIILEACSKNSWLDSRLIRVESGLRKQIKDLSNDSKSIPAICNVDTAKQRKRLIDIEYVKSIKIASSEFKSTLEELDYLGVQIASIINSDNSVSRDIGISTIDFVNARKSLASKIKLCNSAYGISEKFLLDNQENQKFQDQLRRQRAAEDQRRKNFENAVESVILE